MFGRSLRLVVLLLSASLLYINLSNVNAHSDPDDDEEAYPPSISPDDSNTSKSAANDDFEKSNGEIFEKEDGVVVLTDDNFDAFVKANPTSLIEFYAPWCGHCKQLAPAYAEAARKLKEDIPLAKLDATVHKKVAQLFSIQGYPTIKLFKEGIDPIDFDGSRDSEDIVNWVKQKTDPNYVPPKEEVVTLTVETFDEFIADKPITLVEFYAPWCGHCKKLAPEYEKAAKQLKEHNIPLAKVDATVENKLAERYMVQGFPTLKIFRTGRRFDYNGPRDAHGIVDYMLDQAQPAATHLNTAKDIKQFLQSSDVTVIGFFAAESGELYDALIDASEKTRSDFKVGYTTDVALRKLMGISGTTDTVVMFMPELFWSKYESKYYQYQKKNANADELIAFLREHCTPLVGQKTRNNAATRYSHLPLVVVYYNIDFSLQYRDGTQYWRNKVLSVANEYKDQKYNFAIADEEEFSKELIDIGLGDSSLEHNIIVFGVDGKKYPMNGDVYDSDDLVENLENFLGDISKGKVRPHVKSAPAPKNDKGPVKTVVASTFDAIVKDESKDVLIEFYAPWCGHCKKFEPQYRQFAEKHKAKQPDFVVAKFDGTANDAPSNYLVQGFPTIYFAPAGAKDKPIKYEGNRDLKDLEEFVKKHAMVSFKAAGKSATESVDSKDEL